MKVLIGPLNIATQPYYLARGLREHGIDATCISYGQQKLHHGSDWVVELPGDPSARAIVFHNTLKEALERDFDIYHFFQRSFYLSYPSKSQNKLCGFDIPLLKLRGKKIAYRFTGWELIDREIEMKNNPYSAFKYGWNGAFDPNLKKEWLAFVKFYSDAMMVVDPMMQEHCPEAKIVPRVLRVKDFPHIGIEKKSRPLVLHAPTNAIYKGSKFIIKALNDLKNEGVIFDLKLLDRCPFEEAMEWYKRSDIIVDQALIGWHGVLAMECMAMGKPVAVYMREDLVNTPEDIPVYNFNLDNIKQRLRLLINDYSSREFLAVRGRDYIIRVHDESVVIPKLIDVYKAILENNKMFPDTYDDINYLLFQRLDIEQRNINNNYLLINYFERIKKTSIYYYFRKILSKLKNLTLQMMKEFSK